MQKQKPVRLLAMLLIALYGSRRPGGLRRRRTGRPR